MTSRTQATADVTCTNTMDSGTGESGPAANSESYDVIVVGGGVAGCFAAAIAAD